MKLSDKKKSVQSLYREKVKAKEKKSQLEIMVISISWDWEFFTESGRL